MVKIMQFRYGVTLLMLLFGTGQLMARDYDARIAWAERIELKTAVSGKVKSVPAQVGSYVLKHQLLLQLDPIRFKAKVRQARAAVVKTREALAEARREMKRAKEMFARTLISIHQREMVKIALARAKANHQAALAGLVLARNDLDNAVIRAPYPAIVLEINASKGTVFHVHLNPKPLVVVGRADLVVARFSVSISESRQIKTAGTVRVRYQGKTVNGHVRSVAVEPDQGGRYAVEVAFVPADPKSIRIGEKATVSAE